VDHDGPKTVFPQANAGGRGGVSNNMTGRQRFVPATLFVATLAAPGNTPKAQVAYEVVSIRQNTDPAAPERLRRTPDGGLVAQHFRPRRLITIAYGLQPYQLAGAPAWSNGTFYDITAKPSADAGTSADQMALMLQALLVDRFRLRFHREMRQIDGYALVRSGPQTLGPGLTPSAINCEQTPALQPCRVAGDAAGAFVVSGAPMWTLLHRLISEVNTPIDDETGLAATYDINLRWSADPTATSEHPSLFTAIQEQLGLRLERRRVATSLFIVDRFERPTAD